MNHNSPIKKKKKEENPTPFSSGADGLRLGEGGGAQARAAPTELGFWDLSGMLSGRTKRSSPDREFGSFDTT